MASNQSSVVVSASIRDLVPAIHNRYATRAVVLLGKDGLVIDSLVQDSSGLDSELLAAQVPGIVASIEGLGILKTAVLELNEGGHAIVSNVGPEALLLIISGPGTKLPEMLRDVRAHRENIERLIIV